MTDLTRWNRAGLSRIRYVDGNAVTYFEELRRRLAASFGQWEAVQVAEDEPEAVRRERLLTQYRNPRSDWGLELARVLARSCHVLTEHLDAYANEGYLQTATQWDSVRRLVSMLDYHPAPPASASAPVAIDAPAGASGTLSRGFRLQHVPPSGEPPLVFETLDDLAVDATLNVLRPAGYGRSDAPLAGTALTLDGRVRSVRAGDPVVLEEDGAPDHLQPYLVVRTQDLPEGTRIELNRPVAGFTAGHTLVHLNPSDRLAVLGPASTGTGALGPSIQLREVPAGLAAGDVAYIADGSSAYHRTVVSVQGRQLTIGAATGPIDPSAATVARSLSVPVVRQLGVRALRTGAAVRTVLVAGDWTRLAGTVVAAPGTSSGTLDEYTVAAARFAPVVQGGGPTDGVPAGHTALTLSGDAPANQPFNPQAILVAPPGPGPWALDTTLQLRAADGGSTLPARLETSRPRRTGGGGVVAIARAGQVACARVGSVAAGPDGVRWDVSIAGAWTDTGGGPYFLAQATAYGGFADHARPAGWQSNRTPVAGRSITLDEVPAGLVPGRSVLVEVGTSVVAAHVTGVGGHVVDLDVDVPAGATIDTLLLRANVVTAGHGASVDEQVVGSGDATQAGQSFVLEAQRLSFVTDPTQSTGVRADLDVHVDGRRWKQVPTLDDSEPEDAHYVVRMTEDGDVRLVFGDGRQGRRLPTGADNVRARYRVGAGLAGNLPAGSIEQPVRPDPLVNDVHQPLDTVGGNDLEPTESMRANAPAALLTLDRAVSLADYGYLAATQSSVWAARAMADETARGRAERVRVVVVPAGGGELGTLEGDLTAFLARHAAPGVEVTVVRYDQVCLYVSAPVRVDPARFDPELVAANVRAAIVAAFSLRARSLGDPVYRSDVVRVVESVPGVEDSDCGIGVAEARGVPPEQLGERKIPAAPDQVVALDAGGLNVQVETTEFQL